MYKLLKNMNIEPHHPNITIFVIFGIGFADTVRQNRIHGMYLTRDSEYAVRAMFGLVKAGPSVIVQISDLADDWEIPVGFLRKIIPRLARAGLIKSHRGHNGGISLAASPDNITVYDILIAIDHPPVFNECRLSPAICRRTSYCAVRKLWHHSQAAVEHILDSKSLAVLVREEDTLLEDGRGPAIQSKTGT